MEIKANSIDIVDIKKIKPHPKNPHKHSPEQIDRLAKIISYQGFRSPLQIDKKSGLLVVGHGRLQAAEKIGMTKVPVIYQDFEDEDQIYAHMVADNAIGKDVWAELDLSQINLELENLGPDLDLDMMGLKDFAVDISDKEAELDDKPDYDKEKEYVLEAKFPNEMELMDYHDDLLSRGYIVKIK